MFKETKTFPSQRELLPNTWSAQWSRQKQTWRTGAGEPNCRAGAASWRADHGHSREGGSQLGAALRQAQHAEDNSAETRLSRRAPHGVGSRPARHRAEPSALPTQRSNVEAGGGSQWWGHAHTQGWFRLPCGRNQHNMEKQLSSN